MEKVWEIQMALGDLLVIHDHDRRTQKRKAQKNPQEKQSAVQICESFHRAAPGTAAEIHAGIDRLIAAVRTDRTT